VTLPTGPLSIEETLELFVFLTKQLERRTSVVAVALKGQRREVQIAVEQLQLTVELTRSKAETLRRLYSVAEECAPLRLVDGPSPTGSEASARRDRAARLSDTAAAAPELRLVGPGGSTSQGRSPHGNA
jgi:hypothetical protein